MDVVKSRVEGFGGLLEIDSRVGEGTVITMRLPLTLAIVQVLLVKVRGQILGVPVSHVRHTMLVDPRRVEWSRKQAVIRWGKRVVPLVDLGLLTGFDGRDLGGGDPFPVVLTGQANDCAALAVDGLAGAFEAVIKPLGLPLKKIPGLAGATVMGDGRIVLVLDVKGLR
jgi:two-component system chemotaxis sensor kinase CheA